jgi:integrase
MQPNAGATRLHTNGAYFTKRDRNKAGTIGIYTCKGRQTVRVGDASTRDPDEAELALARFVLTNVEAMVRERKGVTKTDMHLKECLNIYSISRAAFHDEVINKVRTLLMKAEKDGGDVDRIAGIRFQVQCAQNAARKERNNFKLTIGNVNRVWPEAGPKVSAFEQAEQLHCVKILRSVGYADGTIDLMTRIMRGAMHHCERESRLLMPMPAALPKKSWKIKSDEDDIVAYKLPEMVALFNAAAQQETWWRYMNLSTHAARLMTIIETGWGQISVGNEEEPRWKLNPPGKRRTSKRRPVIPLCPTLVAELRSWKRDAARVVSDGNGHPIRGALMFNGIRKAAGIRRGSAKSVRKFIRTWLAVNGVPETIADWFMGHADDGSETGQEFYKDKQPEYMGAVVGALEKLYDALRPLVTGRRFAGGTEISEDQPTVDDLPHAMRVNCVAKISVTA